MLLPSVELCSGFHLVEIKAKCQVVSNRGTQNSNGEMRCFWLAGESSGWERVYQAAAVGCHGLLPFPDGAWGSLIP